MKTGTIIDAPIIPSASEGDDDARWVKHEAHVGADANTALTKRSRSRPPTSTTAGPGGRAPDAPGEVFADSAYRGTHFRQAVRARGGTPRIAATGMWGADEQQTLARLNPLSRQWGERLEGGLRLRRLRRTGTHGTSDTRRR